MYSLKHPSFYDKSLQCQNFIFIRIGPQVLIFKVLNFYLHQRQVMDLKTYNPQLGLPIQDALDVFTGCSHPHLIKNLFTSLKNCPCVTTVATKNQTASRQVGHVAQRQLLRFTPSGHGFKSRLWSAFFLVKTLFQSCLVN